MAQKAGPAAQSFPNPANVGYVAEMEKGMLSDSWKDRYMVLDAKALYVYKGRNDPEPVHVIRLCDKTTCARALGISRAAAFTVRTPLKSYNMDTWMTDIDLGIKGQKQKKGPNISRGV